jgi:hypothetical protein
VVTESSSTYFANNGAAYEWFLGRWSRRLVDRIITFADFAATGDLLDVGCGTGSLAFAMADRWPERRIVGIDAAAYYVTFARNRALGTTPIFNIGDAIDLPFPIIPLLEAARNWSWTLSPIPWPLSPKCGASQFRAGLLSQPSGIFVEGSSTSGYSGIRPPVLIRARGRDRLFSTPLALPGGLVELFGQAGLDQIQQSSITVRMEYSDFSDYWQPLLGGQGPVGMYLVGLEPDLRTSVEEAIRTAYYSGGPDGERSMTATAWTVRAVVP